MGQSDICLPKRIFKKVQHRLLPETMLAEEVAFLFAKVRKINDVIIFDFKDWYFVRPVEYVIQSSAHVELSDEMRPKIIKKAFDLDTSIIEMHSHVVGPAKFSGSDLSGFHEFVPHVWWRLKGKPYGAIVFSKGDFDALVWINNPNEPEPLSKLVIKGIFQKKTYYPNGLTLNYKRKILQ